MRRVFSPLTHPAPPAIPSLTMSRSGLPRWAALAMLPLLVGAVLLMHGLDATAGTVAPVSAVEHHHDTGPHDGGACDSCPGAHHALMACVAVVTAVGICRAARHLRSGIRFGGLSVAPRLVARAWARLCEAAPARAPVWVRLRVMHC